MVFNFTQKVLKLQMEKIIKNFVKHMNLDDILKKLDKSISLSFEESKFMFDELTSGQVSDDIIEKILIKLSSKGESIEEISGE